MKDIRVSIATVVTLLVCIGFIMIYSSSGVYALETFDDPLYFLKRHTLFFILAVASMFSVMAIDYRKLQRFAKPLLLITLGMLVLVLVPYIGKAAFGARRWFSFGPINFQPSELAKITVLIYTADFLARKEGKIRDLWQGFLPLLVVLAITCGLIVKQPDLGNSILIAGLIYVLMFVAGARLRHLFSIGIAALPVLAYLVLAEPYRMRRIVAFLDPWEDSQGVGFQLTQSQIAIGSGGLWGVGPGQSMQKLFYLPAAHTDFIFSIIGEELGLLGTLAVVFLFIVFIWQGARIAKRISDPFGYYLSIGIVTMIGLQALVNIGVSIGALPTKGLPLPFISYGGSALIFNMVAVGLLLNISRVEDL